MTTLAIVAVAVVAGMVALAAVAAFRDVRIARWTGQDPRLDRKARRDAATWVSKTTTVREPKDGHG